MRFVVVTGTGTGVGKTVATAALAARAMQEGHRVSVVKPCQTGVLSDESSDVGTITLLSGCTDVHELVLLDDPLAPDSAARLRGLDIPTVRDLAPRVAERGRDRDLTLVEGAGGVAVRLDTEGGTIASLALALRAAGHQVDVLVVTSLGLGTLNHTELTCAALRTQALEPTGLVLGVVPAELGLAERCNLDDLPLLTGVPVVARIPDGAGRLGPDEFRAAASKWIL